MLNLKIKTGPGLVFIEGEPTKGQVQDDVMRLEQLSSRQHIMSFYIDETEVTNLMYLEYLDWLQFVFPQEEEKYKYIYQGALRYTCLEKSFRVCGRAYH